MAELEQLFHDLEQRHLALKTEFDVVVLDRDSLKGEPLRAARRCTAGEHGALTNEILCLVPIL
jgi:hypothetical protein